MQVPQLLHQYNTLFLQKNNIKDIQTQLKKDHKSKLHKQKRVSVISKPLKMLFLWGIHPKKQNYLFRVPNFSVKRSQNLQVKIQFHHNLYS